MKRLIIMAVIKMCAKALFLTILIGGIIGIIGYTKQWDSPVTYSHAFFLAGCLMIIAGTASRLTAGEDWRVFETISAESFRGMSSGERALFIVNASSQISALILGVLTGLLLILISAVFAYLL